MVLDDTKCSEGVRCVKIMRKYASFCSKTDAGRKRSSNEDSHIVIEDARGFGPGKAASLFAVADGMSGHVGGAIASRKAVDSLRRHCAEAFEGGEALSGERIPPDITRQLEKVVLNIHEEIAGVAERVEEYKYMGTTLSVLLLREKTAYIAHVGDSRIYLLRNDRLEQLTHDDTMAQLSVEMGYMRAEEAAEHPLRHSLVQSLGQGVDEVHMVVRDVERGDVFLLCSDGLYDMLPDGEIREILRYAAGDWRPCDRLVAAALGNGGKDNVTVIVVRIL